MNIILQGTGTGTGDGQKFVETVLARLKPIEQFAKWFFIFLLIVIALMGIAIGISNSECVTGCGGISKIALTWSVSLTVGIASTSVGCLLGFLFGIPRSLQQRTATASASASASTTETTHEAEGTSETRKEKQLSGTQAFRSNTSLEEISDWLTKIIIGIGLVQFQTFIAYLYKAALLASAFVAGKEVKVADDTALLSYSADYSSPFFFALIIATLIAGCLFAYLETRTRLTLLFVSAEDATRSPAEQHKFTDAAARPAAVPVTDETDRRGPPVQAAPATQEDRDIAKIARESLSDPKEIVGWALAQARLGKFDVAEDALRDALQKDPGNDDIRLHIADVRRLRGNFSGSNEMTNEVIRRTTDPDKRIALLKRSLLAALYIPEPHGFQQAILVSDQLLAQNAADAQVYVWRAAAFGQQHQWLRRNSGKAEQLQDARIKALEAVTKAVELSSDYDSPPRRLLRQLLNPELEKSMLDESDLIDFKEDEAFKEIIYRDKPAG